ncbi:MAG TPA: SPFH domain-containing protein [Thermomicrobiales bacterium]|nr:SPFH domain-containing protein [Thermomicrobiales bacterium]
MGDYFVITIGVLFILAAMAGMLYLVNANIIKVAPSTVAIFSGRKRTIVNPETGERQTVGYRIIKGGSSVRVPIRERVDYLSLNVITIPLRISSAYTSEGVPVSVDAVANVKIGGDDFSIGNAIERFLGMDQATIQNVIFQTMEGHLRSILGTLTVEEINTDRQAFAQRMTAESAEDLRRMGIDIDVLTIQQISDPNGYLEALGQRRTAEVKRDAEIGRAEADRDARTRSASAMQLAATAEARAEAEIASAQRDTNVAKATYEAAVLSEQARAAQAGPLAQAEAQREVVVAQQNVELARTEAAISVQEMEAKRKERELEATVLKQAEAERQATIITAEGARQATILKAEGEQQAIITRAQAESRQRELLGAGEAARVRQEGLADAEAKKALAEATRAELLAVAEGRRAQLLAEAEGTRAALLAEAEGKTQLAEALNAYGPEAIQLLMYQAFVEQLPKVVEAAALPLSTIDKVVLIDGGGSNGLGSNGSGSLGRYAGELPMIVERMTESFAAVTGIDLKQVVRDKTGIGAEDTGNGRTVIDAEPKKKSPAVDD